MDYYKSLWERTKAEAEANVESLQSRIHDLGQEGKTLSVNGERLRAIQDEIQACKDHIDEIKKNVNDHIVMFVRQEVDAKPME